MARMKTMFQASLPLCKGTTKGANHYVVSEFLGSATIIGDSVCTCKHVIESVDFSREVVLTKWDLNQKWVVFNGADIHKKFDFAVLRSKEKPPFEVAALYQNRVHIGTTLYVAGFHFDRIESKTGPLNINLVPRIFFGNVVRVWEKANNKSPTVSELSFPTLSGFSGAPLISTNYDSILGMVYGNVEQSIQVHSKHEMRDEKLEFSETVNRIIELGLFHTSKDLQSFLTEMGPT